MRMNFISGVIAGALMGTAITMMVDPINDRQRRKLHKGTHTMFKTMGSVLDAMMPR